MQRVHRTLLYRAYIKGYPKKRAQISYLNTSERFVWNWGIVCVCSKITSFEYQMPLQTRELCHYSIYIHFIDAIICNSARRWTIVTDLIRSLLSLIPEIASPDQRHGTTFAVFLQYIMLSLSVYATLSACRLNAEALLNNSRLCPASSRDYVVWQVYSGQSLCREPW